MGMVGYKESKYSFNDPMDEWEKAMMQGGVSKGRRVLAEGYAGLARDAAKSIKGTVEIVARFLNPFRGLPDPKRIAPKIKNERDDEYLPPSRGKPNPKPKYAKPKGR